MKQSDQFGDFNRLRRDYPSLVGDAIDRQTSIARQRLLEVSDPSREFYDVESYIDEIVGLYRMLYWMVRTR